MLATRRSSVSESEMSVHTPRYVHYLLDHLFRGVPLNFHGAAVPADVRRRILLEHRRDTAPAPIAPAAGLLPRQPREPRPSTAGPSTPAGPPSPPGAPDPASGKPMLTDRELQVLTGMADGLSNLRIGQIHHIAEDTVKTHARRLFRKLGARDRAHAVALGFRTGLIK